MRCRTRAKKQICDVFTYLHFAQATDSLGVGALSRTMQPCCLPDCRGLAISARWCPRCGACFSVCASHRWSVFYCPWKRAGSTRQCLCRVPLSHHCELLATQPVDMLFGYDDLSWMGMPPPPGLFPQWLTPGTSWVSPMQAEQSNHTARRGPGALQAKGDKIVNKKLNRNSNAAVVRPKSDEVEAGRTFDVI